MKTIARDGVTENWIDEVFVSIIEYAIFYQQDLEKIKAARMYNTPITTH